MQHIHRKINFMCNRKNCVLKANMLPIICPILEGSFSAVLKPIFGNKHSRCSPFLRSTKKSYLTSSRFDKCLPILVDACKCLLNSDQSRQENFGSIIGSQKGEEADPENICQQCTSRKKDHGSMDRFYKNMLLSLHFDVFREI